MAFDDNSDNQMDSGNFGGDVSQSTTEANDSYDFGSFENDGQNGGNSFGGDDESNANSTNSAEEGQQGGDDIDELLGQSPFGRLLDIDGVDGAEDIFGNVGGGDGGQMGSSQGGAGGGNPFANFNPLEDGNPFIEGDEPNVSFSGAGENSSSGGADGFGDDVSANSSEMETDGGSFSGVFPEDTGSYNYDLSEVDGQYDFSGGMSADSGGENPFAGGGDESSNPFAGGDVSFGDTESDFGGMMGGFGM